MGVTRGMMAPLCGGRRRLKVCGDSTRPLGRRAAPLRATLAPSCGHDRSSLNEPIRPLQQWRWNREAERLGGLQIDDELELRGLFDRQVGRLGSFEDPVDEPRRLAAQLPVGGAVAGQAARSAKDGVGNIVGNVPLGAMSWMKPGMFSDRNRGERIPSTSPLRSPPIAAPASSWLRTGRSTSVRPRRRAAARYASTCPSAYMFVAS